MKKSFLLPLLAINFYHVMGGFDFIVLDKLTATISPAAVIFLRLLLAAVVLMLYAAARKISLRIKKADLLRVILCGGIGFALYYTLEATGIEKTSGSLASLILALIPFFGMVGDRIVFKNPISWKKGACACCSIGGVFLIVTGSSGADLTGTVYGIMIMFAAALAWTSYIILVKPLQENYDLIAITAVLFLVGTVFELPVFLASGPAEILKLGGFDWTILIASGIICIALGQVMYIYGVGRLSVTTVSLYANLLPLVTVIFSFLFFGQVLTIRQLIGGAVILTVVTLASILPDNGTPEPRESGKGEEHK